MTKIIQVSRPVCSATAAGRYFGPLKVLWEGRFKSSLVDSENNILRCYRYIEQNPVRTQMVLRAEDYRWSSVNANAFWKPDPVVSRYSVFLYLGKDRISRQRNYQVLFCELVTEHEISKIRAHINQGKVLGSSSGTVDGPV